MDAINLLQKYKDQNWLDTSIQSEVDEAIKELQDLQKHSAELYNKMAVIIDIMTDSRASNPDADIEAIRFLFNDYINRLIITAVDENKD